MGIFGMSPPFAGHLVVPGAGLEPARPCGQGIFVPLWLSPPL